MSRPAMSIPRGAEMRPCIQQTSGPNLQILWASLIVLSLVLGCQHQEEPPPSTKSKKSNVVRTCAPGWASCDDPDGLCRAQLSSDPKNCGACGVVCPLCDNGECKTKAIQVAVTGSHSCAAYETGRVACWGSNELGELGTGTAVDSALPVWVPGLNDVIAIDTAWNTTCVLHRDRHVSCWGNNYLRAPHGNPFQRSPRPIEGLTDVEAFVLSPLMPGRGMALRRNHQVVQWNAYSGDNLTTYAGIFRAVHRGGCREYEHGEFECKWGVCGEPFWGRVEWLEGASHVGTRCATYPDGSAKCAEQSEFDCHLSSPRSVFSDSIAQITDNRIVQMRSGGVRVFKHDFWYRLSQDVELTAISYVYPEYKNVKQLVGEVGSCAVDQDGRVLCEGCAAQLGIGLHTEFTFPTPRRVPELERFTTLDDGCYLEPGGQMVCREDAPRLMPVGKEGKWLTTFATKPIEGLSKVVGFSSYWAWTDNPKAPHQYSTYCAITEDRDLWCWGLNDVGQLGDGTTTSTTVPKKVEGIADVAQVGVSGTFVCARTQAGDVYCWGENRRGRVRPYSDPQGFYSAVDRPALANPEKLRDVVDLSVGYLHSCAARADGAVYCWGSGEQTLGWFPPESCSEPTVSGVEPLEFDVPECWGKEQLVEALPPNAEDPAVRVLATEYESCALRRSGLLECWGPSRGKPGQLPGLEGVKFRDFATSDLGGETLCAVTMDGRVFCWGDAKFGAIGDGSRTFSGDPHLYDVKDPKQVRKLTDARSVMCGNKYCCATTEKSEVHCWGELKFGDVGWVEEVCGGPVEVPEPIESTD